MSDNSFNKVAIVAGGAVVGAVVVAYGVPAAVGAVGFKSTGILAGSKAAGMMGAATKAGSFVSVAQSIGATGVVATSTKALGAVAGGIAGYIKSKSK